MSTTPTSARQLRTLRIRITGLITLLAAVIVLIFAVVAIRLDSELRDEQLDAELLRVTTATAGVVGFNDGYLDVTLTDLDRTGGDVLVGVRPEFDVFAIVDEADFWDEVPEFSDADAQERIEEVLDQFGPQGMAGLLDLDAPLGDQFMRDQLRAVRYDELYDEAYRGFLYDVAEADGLNLTMATEFAYSVDYPLSESESLRAIERVADEGESGAFLLSDERLMVRGVPLREGAETRGAIIAVADPTDSAEGHAAFRRGITLLGLLLVVGAAAAAWFVAGRTVQPAARALAQQERFLADAAHELRTPVAAIRATAEAATAESSGSALVRVSELATGAGQLTDDLLTLARMDADRLTLERELVRLDLLVEALIDDDPAFRFDPEAEAVINADPRLVERAVDNLLRNARLHGGATDKSPAHVMVSASCEVRVEDSGPGIDAAVGDEIFERFRSGSTSAGHGLGLALTRWIARAHGGDCIVESPASSGARFVVWFGPNDRH